MYCNSLTRYKIVLIGNTGVGKTSLINIFNKRCNQNTSSTIGAEYCSYISEDNNLALEIWDTAGQERFRSMITTYFRNAHVCILVFDITIRESFDDIKYWLNEVKEKNDRDNLLIYLVANKIDLVKNINYNEYIDYAKENNLRFIKTTIIQSKTIENLITLVIEDLKTTYKDEDLNNIKQKDIIFTDLETIKTNSCCY